MRLILIVSYINRSLFLCLLKIIGTTEIAMPSEISINISDDNITHTWSHPNPEIVQHYRIVLDDDGPEVWIDSTSVVIARVPGLPYSGSLSAVSICQRESEARRFEGICNCMSCL